MKYTIPTLAVDSILTGNNIPQSQPKMTQPERDEADRLTNQYVQDRSDANRVPGSRANKKT